MIIHVLFSFKASKSVREIVWTKTKIAKLRLLTFKGNVKMCNRVIDTCLVCIPSFWNYSGVIYFLAIILHKIFTCLQTIYEDKLGKHRI